MRPPRDKEVDRILAEQRGDPVQHWLIQAQKRATDLHLPRGFLMEAAGIIATALTPELIRKEVDARRRGLLQVYHGHPLVGALSTADDAGLAHVLEVAVYLKRMATTPGIARILPGLRDEGSYPATCLQLAFAYRFMKAGAVVSLEPESLGETHGDILFEVDGRKYQVECFARRPPADPYKEFVAHSVGSLLAHADRTGRRLRILVRLHAPPDTKARLEIEHVGFNLVDGVAGEQVSAATATAQIEVEDLAATSDPDFLPNGDPNPDGPYASSTGLVTTSSADLARVLKTPHDLGALERRSRLFWWRVPGEGRAKPEALSALLDRMEKKIAQAHDPSQTAGRLLIAQVLEGDARILHRQGFLRAVHDRLFPRHERLAAVLIVARVWRTDNRFRYVGGLVSGRQRDPAAGLITTALNRIDHDFDILEDYA